MKKVLFLMLFLLILGAAIVHAQVKIGDNTAPRTGAVLDLKTSYVGGLLLPNVNIVDTGKIDFTPATLWNVDSNHDLTGLIVYNTNETTGKGVYVWDGETWLAVGLGGGGGGPVNPGCGTLTIDSQTPSNTAINANAGDAVTLSVTATITDGNTPIFKWYQNTAPGTSGSGAISGNTVGSTSSLTVPTVGGTVMYYYCVVVNQCDMSEELSNQWGVTVATPGPGNTFLGQSNNCEWQSKPNCTCASGTPLGYDEMNQQQRDATQPYATGYTNQMWKTNRNNDYNTAYYSMPSWVFTGNILAFWLACF